MDNKESEQITGNSIVKHIFKFDDETKSNLTNLAQYTLLAIIPIALLQIISDKLVPEYDEERGTMEILAEVSGQIILSLLGLFFIHRIITCIPTLSGNAMSDINLFTISVVFLSTALRNKETKQKIKLISSRILETWDGKPQPISRGGMPTHQTSRADYIGTHNNIAPPQQEMASQASSSTPDQQMYAGQQGAPPVVQEPMAGGSFLGGGFAGAGAPF